MTEKQEKLIESYIRKQVRQSLKEKSMLSEAKIIIPADGQKDALVVGGVGTTLYISQKTETGVHGVQFTLKQMRRIVEYFSNYDPQSTTVRSISPGQRQRIGTK